MSGIAKKNQKKTPLTQPTAHAWPRVQVRLQRNGILTVCCVVLSEVPHLDHTGWEKLNRKKKNIWIIFCFESLFIQVCCVLENKWQEFLTRRRPQRRWVCADPETKPPWRSAGSPARNKRVLKDLPTQQNKCFQSQFPETLWLPLQVCKLCLSQLNSPLGYV